jgi:hypothetical protein
MHILLWVILQYFLRVKACRLARSGSPGARPGPSPVMNYPRFGSLAEPNLFATFTPKIWFCVIVMEEKMSAGLSAVFALDRASACDLCFMYAAE